MDSFQLNNKIFAREGSGRSLRIMDRGMNDIVITPLNDNQIAVSVIGSLEPLESAARSEGVLNQTNEAIGRDQSCFTGHCALPHALVAQARGGGDAPRTSRGCDCFN